MQPFPPPKTYRKRLLAIIDRHRAQARWYPRLLDWLIKRPDLQQRLPSTFLHPTRQSAYHPKPSFTRAAQPTATVTSKLVPSTCRICVIPQPAPSSYAGNRRTTFQLGPTMRTSPSGLPRNRLSEPQHRAEMLLPAKRSASASEGGAICVVSKKVKDRHWGRRRGLARLCRVTVFERGWKGGVDGLSAPWWHLPRRLEVSGRGGL